MANAEHLSLIKHGVQVWNRWIEQLVNTVPHPRPDLIGADFDGSDLRFIHLVHTDLKSAKFKKANLMASQWQFCDFAGADLSEAQLGYTVCLGGNMSGATLERAQCNLASFTSTDFTGVVLRNSFLSHADFNEVNFSGADFSSANLYKTSLAAVDLSQAKGLEDCRHDGPSTIGIDTLRKSKGQIPLPFLRGCGLDDWEIEVAKLFRENLSGHEQTDILYRAIDCRRSHPISFYSCFISYSHENRTFAHRLHDALQERGIRCWLDSHQLIPGDDMYDQIDRGIRMWDKVLLCCSEAALKSWWVDNEISVCFEKEQALSRERGRKVMALIPLNLDNYLFSDGWHSGYRAQIRRRLAADFVEEENFEMKFEVELEKVLRALRADGSERDVAPDPKL